MMKKLIILCICILCLVGCATSNNTDINPNVLSIEFSEEKYIRTGVNYYSGTNGMVLSYLLEESLNSNGDIITEKHFYPEGDQYKLYMTINYTYNCNGDLLESWAVIEGTSEKEPIIKYVYNKDGSVKELYGYGMLYFRFEEIDDNTKTRKANSEYEAFEYMVDYFNDAGDIYLQEYYSAYEDEIVLSLYAEDYYSEDGFKICRKVYDPKDNDLKYWYGDEQITRCRYYEYEYDEQNRLIKKSSYWSDNVSTDEFVLYEEVVYEYE